MSGRGKQDGGAFVTYAETRQRRSRMKRLNPKTAVVACLLAASLLPGLSFGQSKIGTSAAPFLTIGVGCRPQAMGGAFVSISDDVHALYWNPAGIARLNHSEVLLSHSTWLANMAFDYIGGVVSMGSAGAFGVSTTLLSVGEMEVTTERFQEGTGLKFNSYDLAAAVSYGYKFYDRFSIGVNVKYIHQQIWNETADGMAIDLGTLLITPLKGIRLGMNISNFGTKMQMTGRDLMVFYDPDPTKEGNNPNIPAELSTDKWKLPLTMRLGVSGEVIKTDRDRLTLALDWVVPNDNDESLNVGTEYAYKEFFFLRAGYRSMRPALNYSKDSGYSIILAPRDTGGGPTFGGGVRLGLPAGIKLEADYAYESYDRLGSIYKYSLGFRF